MTSYQAPLGENEERGGTGARVLGSCVETFAMLRIYFAM
jgi:hypothetical protein